MPTCTHQITEVLGERAQGFILMKSEGDNDS